LEDFMPDRESRVCDVCGQVDDHPRHIIHVAAGHPVTGAPMDLTVTRHIDCCQGAGCPDGSCDVVLGHAGAKRGPDLVAHLESEGAAIRNLMDQKIGAV
jgi:hypothetical protein